MELSEIIGFAQDKGNYKRDYKTWSIADSGLNMILDLMEKYARIGEAEKRFVNTDLGDM